MNPDWQKLRVDGVYRQNDNDDLMMRVKIPGGVLSSLQAEEIAGLSDRFSNGELHLTCRGSIELHWLRYEMLDEIGRILAAVGLTSRGACGGAVRGVSCSLSSHSLFSPIQSLARRLHRYFTGNPRFEGLPKKFKIAVEPDHVSGRYLIQDVGLVYRGRDESTNLYELWAGGGLGRAPQEAIRLYERLPEEQVVSVIERILGIYRERVGAGRRLKSLVAEIGPDAFQRLVTNDWIPESLPLRGLGYDLGGAGQVEPLILPTFAGQITSRRLREAAGLARQFAGSQLAVSAEQDLAFFPASPIAAQQLAMSVEKLVAEPDTAGTIFRVCPGSHLCRMGLAPTRDLARAILEAANPQIKAQRLAISGCPNSCSQPQLADIGIVTTGLHREGEQKSPRFTLLRRSATGLGAAVAVDLDAAELIATLNRYA